MDQPDTIEPRLFELGIAHPCTFHLTPLEHGYVRLYVVHGDLVTTSRHERVYERLTTSEALDVVCASLADPPL